MMGVCEWLVLIAIQWDAGGTNYLCGDVARGVGVGISRAALHAAL